MNSKLSSGLHGSRLSFVPIIYLTIKSLNFPPKSGSLLFTAQGVVSLWLQNIFKDHLYYTSFSQFSRQSPSTNALNNFRASFVASLLFARFFTLTPCVKKSEELLLKESCKFGTVLSSHFVDEV